MKAKIEMIEVSKSYATRNGRLPVLDSIDLSLADGEFVALVGASGCGKSTLLKIMAGFDRPDRGTVKVDGELVERPRRKGMYVFQQGSLFPWLTVRDNLEFGLNGEGSAERRRLSDEYLAMVRLEAFARAFPHQLSGGMLQRAELARALIVKPDILFMDEPFGALDALTRLRMRAELISILSRERVTVVFVTHDVEEALHLADRVVVLTPRPARIKATLDVPFARPRTMSRPAMADAKDWLLRELDVQEDACA